MIKEILMSSNYWVLNKNVVKEFGIETAFILSNLAEADKMMSDDDGWFYQTGDTLEEITGLSRHKQAKAITNLINCGALTQKNKGVPMKRFFKLNYDVIQKLVFKKFKNCNLKNLKTSSEKNEKLVVKKFKRIKKVNKESKINKIDKESINLFLKSLKGQFKIMLGSMDELNIINFVRELDFDVNEEYERSSYLKGQVEGYVKPSIRMFYKKDTYIKMKNGEYRNRVNETIINNPLDIVF